MKKLLVYESSINNKKSTISIGYILQGDSDLVNYSLNEIDRRINKSNQSDTKIVGIQIEDEQFRQFVLSKKDSEKLFQNMEKQGFFENCHDLQKDKLFCKYGDTFKYRYTKLQISDFDGILYQVVQYFNKVERLESNLLQI
ncbi:hypothetical protein FYC62_01580 [Pedobacter aquae]|nr:hypothetical protein [Pedobacter aquae]QEK50501.1 hypothetical protein FYC62_01580 [Pedobacter aquae]